MNMVPVGQITVVTKEVRYSIVEVRVTTLVAVYTVIQEGIAVSEQMEEVIVEVSVDRTIPPRLMVVAGS